MKKNKKEGFGKIIYFDEQAALDLLELENEGEESIVIKRLNKTVGQVEGNATIGKGFLDLVKFKISGSASHQRNNIIETQITSTLISSFMEVIYENDIIVSLENPKLIICKDSPAYYRNLVPVLYMIEDINKLNSLSETEKENFNGINIKGIEGTLDSLSGYYEFLCIDNNKKMIARFNIDGLRNNYNLNDLTKMNLKLFGVKVGQTTELDLDFNKQIDRMTNLKENSVIGIDFDEYEEEKYDIIDIILAGV